MTSLARQHSTNPLTKAPALECNGLAAAKSAAGSQTPLMQEARSAPLQKALFSCLAHGVRPCGGAMRGPFGVAGCLLRRCLSPYGPASTRLKPRETALPTFTQEAAMCIARPPTLEAQARAQHIVPCQPKFEHLEGRS